MIILKNDLTFRKRKTRLKKGDVICHIGENLVQFFREGKDGTTDALKKNDGDDKFVVMGITGDSGFHDVASLIACTHGFSIKRVERNPNYKFFQFA